MIRVITSFKKAKGKTAQWCSDYYRNSHVQLAQKEFLKFPYIKKFSTTKVLQQMEIIQGRRTEEPSVLWIGEVFFDSLREFDEYLKAQTLQDQISDDRVYASELDVYVCGEEEVVFDRLPRIK